MPNRIITFHIDSAEHPTGLTLEDAQAHALTFVGVMQTAEPEVGWGGVDNEDLWTQKDGLAAGIYIGNLTTGVALPSDAVYETYNALWWWDLPSLVASGFRAAADKLDPPAKKRRAKKK